MLSEHPLVELSKLATVYSGYAFKKADFNDVGIPIVKIKNVKNRVVDYSDCQCFLPKNLTEKHKKYMLKSNDVLIAMTGQGSVGRVGKIRIEPNNHVLLNQRVGRFIVNEKLNNEFLFQVLTTPLYQQILFDAGTGSGQPNLSPSLILSQKIPLPPLAEQKRIAHLLGSLDDKIELNRKMNETLEEMAQAIFKSWFIDFDGVPTEDLVDSELGLIPKGWEVKTLKDLGKVVTGKTPPKKVKENYGYKYPFIKIPFMHGKMWISQTGEYLSERGHLTQKAKLLPPKSVIISCIATVGLVSLNRVSAHTNQQINSIIPKDENLYIWLYFMMKNSKQELLSRAVGGSVTNNLNKGQFEKITVVLPTKEQTDKYFEGVNPLMERVAFNQKQSQTLSELRDTLLPKLISGEIRIPEAEEQVEQQLSLFSKEGAT